jgi:transposase
MSDEIEELSRRLVVGRKSDGRSVYDEAAKAELVAACGRPGASVSRLARECGVNANQLSRWVREHSQRRQRAVAVSSPQGQAFVAVPIATAAPMPMVTGDTPTALRMNLQARLPNGVVLDLRELELRQAGVVIAALGRLRCSASTKS